MVDLLANFGPIRDPSAPELSGVTTYTFLVIGGADSTAPSSGRARSRYPAPQQYPFDRIVRHNILCCFMRSAKHLNFDIYIVSVFEINNEECFLQINDLHEGIGKVLQDISTTFLVKLPGAASWTEEEFVSKNEVKKKILILL